MATQVAHLKAGRPAASAAAAGPLAQASVLGPLLPESLLYVLTTSGAGAFSEALIADADTPELVWTHRMRAQVLVPQVRDGLSERPQIQAFLGQPELPLTGGMAPSSRLHVQAENARGSAL